MHWNRFLKFQAGVGKMILKCNREAWESAGGEAHRAGSRQRRASARRAQAVQPIPCPANIPQLHVKSQQLAELLPPGNPGCRWSPVGREGTWTWQGPSRALVTVLQAREMQGKQEAGPPSDRRRAANVKLQPSGFGGNSPGYEAVRVKVGAVDEGKQRGREEGQQSQDGYVGPRAG